MNKRIYLEIHYKDIKKTTKILEAFLFNCKWIDNLLVVHLTSFDRITDILFDNKIEFKKLFNK